MEPFNVKAKKGRLALLGFGALIFVLLGIVFLVFAPEAEGGEGAVLTVVGAVCILFFGLCLVWYVKRLLDPTPMLTISDEGILDRASYASAGLIRWEEIKDIQALRMYNQDFLCIFTYDPDLVQNRFSGFKKTLHRMNKGLSPAQAHIPLKMLACPPQRLMEEINKRAAGSS